MVDNRALKNIFKECIRNLIKSHHEGNLFRLEQIARGIKGSGSISIFGESPGNSFSSHPSDKGGIRKPI